MSTSIGLWNKILKYLTSVGKKFLFKRRSQAL
jgi:hypothetical protein